MSELLDKQVNAQKENFWGSHKLPQAHGKKCAMTMKETRIKKRRTRKNIIHRRKPFITSIQETGENDLHQLQANDYGYNEGTICLVNR